MKKQLLLLVMILLPMVANADDSGTCGNNLTWTYEDATQTLTISGNGEMDNYGLGNSPWYNYCSQIAKLIIEDGVTNIGNWAFNSCTSLTSIIIPNSVTSIGDSAFRSCSGLLSVTIGDSVTSIGSCAFMDCNGLISINIPNGVISIGSSAFDKCSGLISVSIPNSVTSIGSYVFYGCSGLTSITIPNSVPLIADYAFWGCTSLTSITIPNNVKSIGICAFQDCISLTSIDIPNSVTSIGNYAFRDCASLTSVTIPSSVTSIGEEAFAYCRSIISLALSENLKIIKKQTFYSCRSLTSVTIPASVEYIYAEAFANCNSLDLIKVLSNTPPFLFDNAFSNYSIPVFVPDGCKEAYQNAQGWKNFTNISDGKYKLTYLVDGEEYKSYIIEYGATITPEPAPTKEGYSFSGWEGLPEVMPAHDVDVNGTFSINTYKLIYMVDGAEYKTYEVEYNTIVPREEEPTKEGYTFSGWSEIPQMMPAHDVTITGTFSVNKYLLTYLVDGVEYKKYEVEYGATITPEAAPTKEGYTFSGWSDIPKTMPAYDVTVTGTFKVNKYNLIYMVDGEEYKTYEVEYNSSITAEEVPIKDGYTFSGWSEIPATMPAHDVTIRGSFTINKYKLIYKVDGAEYKSYEVEFGATITPEAEPTKEGYTFSGWSWIPTKMPAEDVTVTGSFTINQYTITYIIDNEVYTTQTVNYGSTIIPPTAPEREGYDFAWGDYPETMPAYDITIYGTYTTGIEAIMVNEVNCQIFSLDGKTLNKPQKGVNIVRMSNGQVRKVVVK